MAKKPQMFRFVSKEPVRISYPNFFQVDRLSEKYSCFFLLDKEANKASIAHMSGLIKEAIADGAATIWDKAPAAPVLTVYDGDKAKPGGGEWPEEYKGCMILKATSAYPTKVFYRDKTPIIAGGEMAAKIFGGVYGFPIVDFTAYDAQGKKGVKCYLAGFMYSHEGEALGGGGGSIVADLPDVEIDETANSNPADDLAALLG